MTSLRTLIQTLVALGTNAYLLFPWGGSVIYQGPLKAVCHPGLNCYSCPAALLSCPVGATQNFIASLRYTAPGTFPHLGLTIIEGVQDLVVTGKEVLGSARRILQDAGLEGCWQEKLVGGEPAQAIVHYAEAGGYPLIMMGSQGHSALAQLLIGSVTSTVVYTASQAAVAVVYG